MAEKPKQQQQQANEDPNDNPLVEALDRLDRLEAALKILLAVPCQHESQQVEHDKALAALNA